MEQQKKNNINKGSAVGVVIGVALGILVTLIFKKSGVWYLNGYCCGAAAAPGF